MRYEKAVYSLRCIGPGGRHCACCAPPPRELKRQEKRKARRTEYKHIRAEMIDGNGDDN